MVLVYHLPQWGAFSVPLQSSIRDGRSAGKLEVCGNRLTPPHREFKYHGLLKYCIDRTHNSKIGVGNERASESTTVDRQDGKPT